MRARSQIHLVGLPPKIRHFCLWSKHFRVFLFCFLVLLLLLFFYLVNAEEAMFVPPMHLNGHQLYAFLNLAIFPFLFLFCFILLVLTSFSTAVWMLLNKLAIQLKFFFYGNSLTLESIDSKTGTKYKPIKGLAFAWNRFWWTWTVSAYFWYIFLWERCLMWE